MNIFSDMHIHTDRSLCCRSPEQTVDNIIGILTKNGMKKIGFADHLWHSDTVEPSEWYKSMNGSANLELHNYIHSHSWDIEIMVGCEADTRAPGVFGITPDLREKLDYVVMSASHFHMRSFVEQPKDLTPRGIADHLLKFFKSAAASRLTDAIVHPLFPFGFDQMYESSIAAMSDNELCDALHVAAENGVGIEINQCSIPNPDLNRNFSLEVPVRIFELAKQAGCKFTFGSDSHAPKEFETLLKMQYFADKLELTEDDLHPIAK